MQMKILGAVVIATGLTLAGCGGSSGSTSSGSTGTTGNTTSQNTTGNTTSPTTSTGTTGTGSTSTGTTGTGSTSTSSSSSSSTGTSGQNSTDANCGATHAVCSGDDHCHDYGPDLGLQSSQHLYECGCHISDLGDGGSLDSCAANTDDNIVCDADLGHCRPPRDYEPAGQGSSGFICDTGYAAVNFGSDAAPNVLCLGTCSVTNDCRGNDVYCLADSLTTDDGGMTGACVENDCGPDLQNYPTYDDGGVILYGDGGHELYDDGGVQSVPAPAGQYYATCDVNGANNAGTGSGGTCLPLPTSPTSYIGVCYRNGTAQLNDGCTGLFGSMTDQAGSTTLNACGAGMYCLSGTNNVPFPSGSVFPNQPDAGGPTIFTATCVAACNASPEDDGGADTLCPSVGGATQTCTAVFSTDPDVNGIQWAICQ